MAKPFHLDLVATDRNVWSGETSLVVARTQDGEIGIMADHEPLAALLDDGVVRIEPADGGSPVIAAVHGGFMLLDSNEMSILAETAELSTEIDVERAKAALARAHADGATDKAAIERAETRLRAALPHAATGR